MASAQAQPFATLLRRYRVAAGLTQEELAERAALSVGAISTLERGLRRTPHRYTAAQLADAVGLAGPERARFEAAARDGDAASSTPSTLLARPGMPRSCATDHPLIGRAREWERLVRHLAGDGPPLLLLAGEPGIGKSRLLREVGARASETGWTVLWGGCTRRDGQTPFAPLLGALANFVAVRPPALLRTDLESCAWLARLVPELAERGLAPRAGWALPLEQERRLMFGAVERFLANVAGPAGTVVVLDDLQWAGPDALHLLATLARAVSERPLRLLAAFRPTEVRPDAPLGTLIADLALEGLVEEVDLGPLATHEADMLLRHLLDAHGDAAASGAASGAAQRGAVDESVRQSIARRADGVPYFLVSLAQALRAGAPDGEVADDVPWSVRQSIRQRVAALEAPAREVLHLAAVAGRCVPRGLLLAAVVREPAGRTTVGAIEVLLAAGFLLEDGADDYRFAHDLVREVVEGDLRAARRAELRGRLAAALEHHPAAALVEPPDPRIARAGAPAPASATTSRSRCRHAVAARPRPHWRPRGAANR